MCSIVSGAPVLSPACVHKRMCRPRALRVACSGGSGVRYTTGSTRVMWLHAAYVWPTHHLSTAYYISSSSLAHAVLRSPLGLPASLGVEVAHTCYGVFASGLMGWCLETCWCLQTCWVRKSHWLLAWRLASNGPLGPSRPGSTGSCAC
jgi:hypothetical protein